MPAPVPQPQRRRAAPHRLPIDPMHGSAPGAPIQLREPNGQKAATGDPSRLRLSMPAFLGPLRVERGYPGTRALVLLGPVLCVPSAGQAPISEDAEHLGERLPLRLMNVLRTLS